jgi:hypothetical protein
MRPFKIQLPRGLKSALDLLTKGPAKNQISEGEQFFITDDTLPATSIQRKRVAVGLSVADTDKYLLQANWNDVKGLSVNAGYDFTPPVTHGANTSNGHIAIGLSSVAGNSGSPTSSTNSIAIGTNASAIATSGVAIGRIAQVTNTDTIAIGSLATSVALQGTSLGARTQCNSNFSVAIGYYSQVMSGDTLTTDANNGVISIGSSTFKRRIINGRDGVNDSDFVILSQLKTVESKIPQYELKVTGATGTALISTEAVKVFGNNNIILGIGGQAGNQVSNPQHNCIVIGQGNWTYSDGAIAIGTSAGVYPSCNDSIAIGWRSTVQTTDLVDNDIVFSIGNALAPNNQYARKRRLINMKAGVNPTDGVNVTQLYTNGIGSVSGLAIGAGMTYTLYRPDYDFGKPAVDQQDKIIGTIGVPAASANYDLRDCEGNQLPRVPTAPMPGYEPPRIVQCKDMAQLEENIGVFLRHFDERLLRVKEAAGAGIPRCPITGRFAERVEIDIGSFTATEAWRTVATWAAGTFNGTNPTVYDGNVVSAGADKLAFHVALRNSSNNLQIYPRIALAVTNAKLTFILSTDEIHEAYLTLLDPNA